MGVQLLTIDTAAKMLGVEEKSIRNRIVAGILPILTALILGRQVIRKTDVDECVVRQFGVLAATPASSGKKAHPIKRERWRPRKLKRDMT